MHPFIQPAPSIQENSQRYCLDKKCSSFPRKWHPNNSTGMLHKLWPEQAQFERQNCSGNCAHCKKNGNTFTPCFCNIKIYLFTGFEPAPFAECHQYRHRHTDTGKHNMKTERDRHLKSCCNEVIHEEKFWLRGRKEIKLKNCAAKKRHKFCIAKIPKWKLTSSMAALHHSLATSHHINCSPTKKFVNLILQSAKTLQQNEKTMRKFLLSASVLATIFILPGFVFSQTKLKLSGIVSDSSKPLALVTVRMFKKNSTTPLQTTLSKENGSFQFNKPDTGNYILSFTHTGFAEKRINITVASQSADMQIDAVQLLRATGILKEVVVNSQRPLVEQSDDKIVFNVEDDPTTKTETAIDILRRTPFVSVDGEDNIKVNGKSNFKVLLNNRETSMFARNIKEALRGFPGALISKIEVITTPSAKYDGEGIGGLINIITKKKVVGYNGTLSTFQRTSDKLSNYAINGNAKIGKIGLSVFLNSGYTSPVSQYNINTTVPATQNIYTKRTLDGNQRNNSDWSFGNAELSWEVDSL